MVQNGYSFLEIFPLYTNPFQSLEQLLQLSSNGIADLRGGRLAADVAGAHTRLNDVTHGLLNDAGLVEPAKGVLHHHGNGEDSSDGVDDALAGDVRRGA